MRENKGGGVNKRGISLILLFMILPVVFVVLSIHASPMTVAAKYLLDAVAFGAFAGAIYLLFYEP